MINDIRYPEIEVKLIGEDGNAFSILGRIQSALRRNKVPDSEIKLFLSEATSGNYDELLVTCMKWVNVI